MGKCMKIQELKNQTVEFRVSMYCNACERTVAKVISKIEGVEKFVTDMNQHKVIVTGRIDPPKVLKKLKKKTGKKVAIIGNQESNLMHKDEDEAIIEGQFLMPDARAIMDTDGNLKYCCGPPTMVDFPCCTDERIVHMFNDENVNACSVM